MIEAFNLGQPSTGFTERINKRNIQRKEICSVPRGKICGSGIYIYCIMYIVTKSLYETLQEEHK